MTEPLPPLVTTELTRIRREPHRASDDRTLAYEVLDEGKVAHVGLVHDGQALVLPMAYARDGDRLLLHAAKASRLARTLAAGEPVCVTVTHLDGMVLARSAFNHSMNYRSVMVIGAAKPITDEAELALALDRLVDQLVPGRSGEARPGNRVEVRQTMVLALPIHEASLKVRTGGPNDDEDDLALPVWAGVVPLHTVWGEAIPDASLAPGLDPPVALDRWVPGTEL